MLLVFCVDKIENKFYNVTMNHYALSQPAIPRLRTGYSFRVVSIVIETMNQLFLITNY